MSGLEVRSQKIPTPTIETQQPSKRVLMTQKDTRAALMLCFMKFPQASPSMLRSVLTSSTPTDHTNVLIARLVCAHLRLHTGVAVCVELVRAPSQRIR